MVDADFYDEDYYMKGSKSGYGGQFAAYEEAAFLPMARRRAVWIQSMADPAEVLVLGCARGFQVQALREIRQPRRIFAWGVDISDWAIEHRVSHYVKKADIGKLDHWLFGDYWDVVTAFDVLEHLTENQLHPLLHWLKAHTEWVFTWIPVVDNGVDPSHVTIRPKDWWEYRFNGVGFTCVFDPGLRRQVDGLVSWEAVFQQR